MAVVSVALDVSKLSGWLNTNAPCRVKRRTYEASGMWAGRQEGVGRQRRMQRADEDPTVEIGGRARAERTRNMSLMIVTLDVSKLSGWLNTDAPCRAQQKGGHSRIQL